MLRRSYPIGVICVKFKRLLIEWRGIYLRLDLSLHG